MTSTLSAFFLAAIQWLAELIISQVVIEALGMSAIVTAVVAKFTDKLKSWGDRVVFGGLAFLFSLIAINSFGHHSQKPVLYFTINQITHTAYDEIYKESKIKDAVVIIFLTITNRGDATTVPMKYIVSIDVEGKTHIGEPILINNQIVLHLGAIFTLTKQ